MRVPRTTTPRSPAATARAAAALLAALAAASPGGAGASTMAGQWYHGEWSCRIDGRPARMSWRVVDDPRTVCHGDGTCTSTSGVAERGRFSDNGSRWVPLRRVSSDADTLVLRHADGNRWRLDAVGPRRAEGWTTWQGRRFPLSCARAAR